MPKITGDPSTKQYWNLRVKKVPDLKDMLFIDARRDEYWRRVRETLVIWHNLKVLDVACGYGQFSDLFDHYTGMDFSEEMIRLANEKHPSKTFELLDVAQAEYFSVFDVIFEVNSLRSLGWTAEQFIKKFKPFAKIAVACLEADQFIIHQIYANNNRSF